MRTRLPERAEAFEEQGMKRFVVIGLALVLLVLALPAPGAAWTRTSVHVHAAFGPWWGPGPWYYDPWAPRPYSYWGPRAYPRAYSRAPVLVPQVAVPAPQQYWYYCRDPEGYYPHVAQCPRGWEPVPVHPAPQPGEPQK
jgi:hypothetical protein